MSRHTCPCGAPRRTKNHIACPDCWRRIPHPLRVRIGELYNGRKGSPQHLQAIRDAFTWLRENPAEQTA